MDQSETSNEFTLPDFAALAANSGDEDSDASEDETRERPETVDKPPADVEASITSPASSEQSRNSKNSVSRTDSDASDNDEVEQPYSDLLHELCTKLQIPQALGIRTFDPAASGRKILFAGTLLKKGMESRVKRINSRRCILFNDTFILVKDDSPKKVILKNLIMLSTAILSDIQWMRASVSTAEAAPEYSFQIISPQKIFTLIASNQSEKEQWMKHIQQAIQDLVPIELRLQDGWRHQIFQGGWHAAALTDNAECARGLASFVPHYRQRLQDGSVTCPITTNHVSPVTASNKHDRRRSMALFRSNFGASQESSGGQTTDDDTQSVHLPSASDDVLRSSLYDVNATDADGYSPLMLAAIRGSTDVAQLLVDAGARINDTDLENNTALHLACKFGKDEIIGSLVASGASLNKRNIFGQTPLLALLEMQEEIACGIPSTLESDTGPVASNPSPARSKIVAEMCLDALLLQSGDPDFNARNVNGLGAIHVISQRPYLYHLLPQVVRGGADMNDRVSKQQQLTALHFACGAKLRLDIESSNKSPCGSPNEVLKPNISLKMVRILLLLGAQPNYPTADTGESPLHLVLRAILNWQSMAHQLDANSEHTPSEPTSNEPTPNEQTSKDQTSNEQILSEQTFNEQIPKKSPTKNIPNESKQVQPSDISDEPRQFIDRSVHERLVDVAKLLAEFGARLDINDTRGISVESLASSCGSQVLETLSRAASAYHTRTPPSVATYLSPGDVPGMERAVIGLKLANAMKSNVASPCIANFKKNGSGDWLCMLRRPTNLLPINKSASDWIPDDASDRCFFCHSTFGTFTRRRHHCRSCFALCCSACTRKRFPMRPLDVPVPTKQSINNTSKSNSWPTMERVCDGCFNRLCTDAHDAHMTRSNREQSKQAAMAKYEQENPEKVASMRQDARIAKTHARTGSSTQSTNNRDSRTNELHNAVRETQDRLNERGERLNQMEERSSKLADSSANFASAAEQLAKASKKRSSFFGGLF